MLHRWHAEFGFGHDEVHARLVKAYAEPHRAYHTLSHVRSILQALDAVTSRVRDPLAMRVAAWAHDAVYDPAGKDNELRSAALIPVLFGFVAEPSREAAMRLVRATRNHVPETDDPDESVFLDLDLDLLILAAEQEEFAAYERGIRFEYGFVGDQLYAQGRVAVLERFLARERIFRHPAHLRHEAAARANILRLIDTLRSPPPISDGITFP